MHRRPVAFAVSLVLAASALAACSQEEPIDAAVNGNLGAPVTISVTGEDVPEETTKEVAIAGEGRELGEDDSVLMRATSFDSRTGSIIESYDTGKIRLTTVNDDGLGELATQLVGEREGTRLVVISPGLASGQNAAEIVVVDILPTSASGEETPLPDPTPKGMPTLDNPRETEPAISKGGGEIPELATVTLLRGSGQQVEAADTVIMQYVSADSEGKNAQSTWEDGAPVAANLHDVMEGLQIGLTDQYVGSRVVVLVPSSQAQGDGDVAFIVDILASLPPSDDGATDF
ncbi:MAG: FKBP-type peptidyl-prolyl cis-trans isomerase [Ancrocorticia sp.]|uniref:FKBP-type peptidyl-prolyl cis-trans isomerase n=1 Tax=Ancrocorticia sp. TaxID=2593684 RepID=UPI003F90A447